METYFFIYSVVAAASWYIGKKVEVSVCLNIILFYVYYYLRPVIILIYYGVTLIQFFTNVTEDLTCS